MLLFLQGKIVTATKITTHILIERQLVVYRRERSAVWQCRFSVDGVWQRTSTHERDFTLAKQRAHDILVESNVRKKMNVAPITRFFKDVAKNAVLRMSKELDQKQGKVIYKDYISIIHKYLIPFFGKYKIDSIDFKLLEQFGDWRTKRMLKAPKHSTLMNHNAALNRVFDEAMIRGYIVESNRPKLMTKGKKSERRVEFSVQEAKALKSNFDAWIAMGRADSQGIRALLRDYTSVLLDTGMRPGIETLELKWSQIEIKLYPLVTPTKEVDEEGDPVDHIDTRITAIIKIIKSKTGPRNAIGRAPTVHALDEIARRNYGLLLRSVIKEHPTDYIFRFREYLNDEELALDPHRKPELLKPTSFSKLFDSYLVEHDLLIDPITRKNRVLYSLRHTYATLALTHDNVSIHTLAKQMGTSVGMIERHYSHLDVVKAVHQLHGAESRQLIESTALVDEKYAYKPKERKKRKS